MVGPRWVLGGVLVGFVVLGLQRHQALGPYVFHEDEAKLTRAADRMLAGRTFDPGVYVYPPLPASLVGLGLAIGKVWEGERPRDAIGSTDSDHWRFFHRYPLRGRWARGLFLLLATVTLVAVARLGSRLSGSPWVGVGAVAALCGSELFAVHGTQYLNVDLLGFFFLVLYWNALVDRSGRLSVERPGWAGAVLGLAAACKYTFLLWAWPALLALRPLERREAHRRLILGAGAALGSFLLASPALVLWPEKFWDGVKYQGMIYGMGLPGYTFTPFWGQWAQQLRWAGAELGAAPLVVGLLGAVALGGRSGAARALGTGGALLLLWVGSQRLGFSRNLLPLHGLWAVGAGYAFYRGVRWARDHFEKRAVVGLGLIAVLWGATAPGWRPLPEDSRLVAERWVRAHLPPAAPLRVEHALHVDPRRDWGRPLLVDKGRPSAGGGEAVLRLAGGLPCRGLQALGGENRPGPGARALWNPALEVCPPSVGETGQIPLAFAVD